MSLAATPVAAEDELDRSDPVANVLFGSLEAGPAKTFGAVGLKKAIGGAGLDSSGFRTLSSVGFSREQTQSRRPRGLTDKIEAQSLWGYEWRLGSTFVALYAGPDLEFEAREDGSSVSTRLRSGKRLHGDLWMTPTAQTMLQASAYVSTLGGRSWGRVAPGWSVGPGLYLGPEIEFYRERDYDKLRLGAHLSGLRWLGLTWRVAAGLQRTSDRPKEAYATLGLYWRR